MKRLCLLLIRLYQGVHPAFFRDCCRFQPTCSEYAAQAIESHGILHGLALGTWRILRCQPFAKSGWDPVPAPSTSTGWSAFLPPSTRRPISGHVRFTGGSHLRVGFRIRSGISSKANL